MPVSVSVTPLTQLCCFTTTEWMWTVSISGRFYHLPVLLEMDETCDFVLWFPVFHLAPSLVLMFLGSSSHGVVVLSSEDIKYPQAVCSDRSELLATDSK